MTKEEAKLVLDNARPQTKEIDRQFYDDEDLNNALDMAIKALEQQPSDDCVSRQAVDQNIYDYAESNGLSYANLKNAILDVPPVTPTIPNSDDCVSRQAVIDELNRLGRHAFKDDTDYDTLFDFIDNLPPVTPTFPKGATNGDIIKAIFPNSEIYTDVVNGIVDAEICEDNSELRCSVDWLNAPYDPLDCIPSEYDLFEDMELSNPQMHR